MAEVILKGKGWYEELHLVNPINAYILKQSGELLKYNFEGKWEKLRYYKNPFFFLNENKSIFCGYISFNFHKIVEPDLKIPAKADKMIPLFVFLEFKDKKNPKKEKIEGKNIFHKNLPLKVKINTPREKLISNIKELKKKIEEGDVYVINYSTKFSVKRFLGFDGKKFFNFLQQSHPFPYSIYFNFNNFLPFEIISHSPECFLIRRNKYLHTFPIKGSVKRTRDRSENKKNLEKLLKSKKENSELSMVVDLLRNDLSKISIPGSVKVVGHRKIVSFKTIYHTYSHICGKLNEKTDFSKIIFATFPGGSITGSPKPRSIELIETFEEFSRNIYTGICGIIYPDGNFTFNIAIRTALIDEKEITYHAGGGIVFESDPEEEYKEILLKTKSFFEPLKEYYGYKGILFI